MKQQWVIHSINDLPKVAKELLAFSKSHYFFVFYGEMGAGKTTLIKAIAECLHVVDNTASPTYGLVNEYKLDESGDKKWMIHMDLYRLNSTAEALDVGFEDYIDRKDVYVFVEWPQLVEPYFPYKRVEVRLQQTSEDTRMLDVEIFE